MNRLELEIPVLISPDGRAQAQLVQDTAGDHHEDIGLMEDDFYYADTEYGPRDCQLITVEATIDLDELFREKTVEGSVSSPDEDGRPQPFEKAAAEDSARR